MSLIRLGCPLAIFVLVIGMFFIPLDAIATAKTDEAEEEIDYKELENPIPFTKKSIGRGRMIFKRMCTECHGPDGKGQMDVVADASDLTVPKRYYSGTTVGEVYGSIRNGAGINMPPYLEQLQKEDDLWHLVNFIQSLWPEELKPELIEEEKKEDATGEDN